MTLLDELCDLLADEMIRQERIQETLMKQADAVRTRDLPAMEAATQELQGLHRAFQTARRRQEAVRCQLAGPLGLSPHQTSLSHLIQAVDDPWKSRLSHLQERLQQILQSVESLVRTNSTVLRASNRVVEDRLHALGAEDRTRQRYPQNRGGKQSPVRQPVLIDQRG